MCGPSRGWEKDVGCLEKVSKNTIYYSCTQDFVPFAGGGLHALLENGKEKLCWKKMSLGYL